MCFPNFIQIQSADRDFVTHIHPLDARSTEPAAMATLGGFLCSAVDVFGLTDDDDPSKLSDLQY